MSTMSPPKIIMSTNIQQTITSSSHRHHCSRTSLHVGLLCVSDCARKIASDIQKFPEKISHSLSFPEITNSMFSRVVSTLYNFGTGQRRCCSVLWTRTGLGNRSFAVAAPYHIVKCYANMLAKCFTLM